jgi:uncharacterized protein
MNMNYKEKVDDFLSQKIIAVAGVSRSAKGHVGNPIYEKFKAAGYKTYPVNPLANEIAGEKCYPNLKSIPEKVDAVFVGTAPKDSLSVVKECAELGINRVWFHHVFGPGNYTNEAIQFCKEKNIQVISSGCPMMHVKADPFHKFLHFIMNLTGKLKQS